MLKYAQNFWIFVCVLLYGNFKCASTDHFYSYSIPEPTIRVFYPKGLIVSIDDFPGIKLFSFHANVNNRIYRLEAGTIEQEIGKVIDGKWTIELKDVTLHPGDVLYYWLFVLREYKAYKSHQKHFRVREVLEGLPWTQNNRETINGTSERCVQINTTPTTEIPRITLEEEESSLSSQLIQCTKALLNVTQKIIAAQNELDELAEEKQQLWELYKITPYAKLLTIESRFVSDQDATQNVRYVIRNTLGLNPSIISAAYNSSSRIIFEVATLEEKLEILKEAKKLTSPSFEIYSTS